MSFMKNKFPWLFEQVSAILSWFHDEIHRFANNLMKDLRSLRALFNYVYLLLYVFLCVWGALYYAKDSLNTAIVTTGSIVSAIFAAYVWSTTKEKEIGARTVSPISKPVTHEDEEGAAD